ncbi:MAG: hypothetical protein AAGF47_04430 [Planctomycetota bacterium]
MRQNVPNEAPRMPSVMWVALIALVGLASVQLSMGLTGFAPLVYSGLLCLVLIGGLSLRHRWAHAMTAVACVLTPVMAVFAGEFAAAGVFMLVNALVAVPLVLAAGWFWDRPKAPVWLT